MTERDDSPERDDRAAAGTGADEASAEAPAPAPQGTDDGAPRVPHAGDGGAAVEVAAPSPEAPADESLPETVAVVEALLFASAKPVPLERLAEAAELPEELVGRAVAFLEAACASPDRGVKLDRVAGGVRLVSRADFDYPVRRLLGLDGRNKLSMAALETLSIVAYRQPITGPEIAELRGVNSSSSIRTLLDRKLITTAGRKEVVGTPFLYKTTKEFLVHFGLRDLSDLPKPEELEAVYGLDQPPAEPAQVELFPSEEPGEPDADGAPSEPVPPPENRAEEPS